MAKVVNVADVLSVVCDWYIFKKDWRKCVPDAIKDFFKEHGDVLPLTRQNAYQPAPVQYAKEPGEVIVKDVPDCDLVEAFNRFCDETFRVYALFCEDKGGGYVKIRAMSCPDKDIEWDHKRPFNEMVKVTGILCSMAGFRTNAQHWQYKKPGRIPDEKRSVFIKADQPDWLVKKDMRPVFVGDNQQPKKARNRLIIDAGGYFQVVS